MNKLSRRNLLGLFGLLVGGSSSFETLSGPSVAQNASPTVPEGVQISRVRPANNPPGSEYQRVGAGDWIEHTFSWYTIEEEGPKELEELRKRTTHHVHIDGLSSIDTDAHWKPLTKGRDGTWRLTWSFLTRHRPTGEYRFSVTIDFDQPFTSKRETGERRTHAGTYRYRGRYKVVPESDSISSRGRSNA